MPENSRCPQHIALAEIPSIPQSVRCLQDGNLLAKAGAGYRHGVEFPNNNLSSSQEGRVVKRFFVAVVCAVVLFAGAPAQAAPILTPDSDGVIGVVVFDLIGTPIFMAVTGSSGANVTDGAFITSGTIGVPAADLDTAIFVDFAADDAFFFDFNFATSVFDAALWSVVVDGTPIFSSDPALVPFIGANLGQFSFLTLEPYFGGTQEQVGFLATYALDFIAAPEVTAVPEPATLGLVAMGLAAAARRRRQQKKNI